MRVQATSRADPRQTHITFLCHPSTMTARDPLCWVVSKTRRGFDPRASLSKERDFVNLCHFVLCNLSIARRKLRTARFTFTLGLQGSRVRQVDPAIDRKQHQNVRHLAFQRSRRCHLRFIFFLWAPSSWPAVAAEGRYGRSTSHLPCEALFGRALVAGSCEEDPRVLELLFSRPMPTSTQREWVRNGAPGRTKGSNTAGQVGQAHRDTPTLR